MISNMERSLDFYLQKLGFILKNKWEPHGKIEWCWLELGNAALMLQEYRQGPPSTKLGEGMSICFICEDALAIYDEIKSKGLLPEEPFVGNNAWVVGLTDPDGYRIFFESMTDAPEETMYSDWLKKR